MVVKPQDSLHLTELKLCSHPLTPGRPRSINILVSRELTLWTDDVTYGGHQ